MGELTSIPWVMSAFAGAVYAFVGFRAGRGWYAWAVGAFLLALVVTTWIAGVFVAAYLPVMDTESGLKTKVVLVNGLLIVIPAAFFAWRLKPERAPQPQEETQLRAVDSTGQR